MNFNNLMRSKTVKLALQQHQINLPAKSRTDNYNLKSVTQSLMHSAPESPGILSSHARTPNPWAVNRAQQQYYESYQDPQFV